jgi:hypothetical protein
MCLTPHTLLGLLQNALMEQTAMIDFVVCVMLAFMTTGPTRGIKRANVVQKIPIPDHNLMQMTGLYGINCPM